MNYLNQYEINILNAIQNMRTDTLDDIMVTITALGNGAIFWISLIFVFFSIKSYRKIAEVISISFILNLLIVNILLKVSVGRVRPYEAFEFTDLLIRHLSDNSFPSGHTSYAFSFVTVLFMLSKSKFINWYMAIIAILIAFSRLYLYVHFPTDVLAGAIIGILLGILALKIYNTNAYREVRRKLIYKMNKWWYNIKVLGRCVGIGRRDRLKLCCPPGRVGSSPTTGTNTFFI